MHPLSVRIRAIQLLEAGRSVNAVSRQLHVSRAALRDWRDHGVQPRGRLSASCFVCDETTPGDEAAYAALLGYYLGDGCISRMGRTHALRVSCDRTLPGIIEDVASVMASVHPDGRIGRVAAPGVVVVRAYWKHWPCLFPQHGAGRKHDRRLVLDAWQREIVEARPADLLRGLFHSDGCRVNNWATGMVAGAKKRYDYPRWQFVNVSDDIRRFCTEALDLLDIPWRQSRWNCISVSTRAGVARLDELIGPKT